MLKRSLTLLTIALLLIGNASADQEQRRALIGTRIFGAVLAADPDIGNKCVDGRLQVVVVYQSDQRLADELSARLSSLAPREIGLAVRVVAISELAEAGAVGRAAFIADWIPNLAPLLDWSRGQGALVFSPRLGDVERGVHAGLHVTDRILPLVNPHALQESGITLKPFFMEVAKRYGEDD